MWQGSRLGFVAEKGSFATMDALSTDFLLFSLASFFCSFSPSLSRFVYLLRVASSVQQSSSSVPQGTYSSCVIGIPSHLRTALVLSVYVISFIVQ